MLSLPPAVRIWLSTRPADLRKSFDGLAALARDGLGGGPRRVAPTPRLNGRRFLPGSPLWRPGLDAHVALDSKRARTNARW
jgi:hypothetical protein